MHHEETDFIRRSSIEMWAWNPNRIWKSVHVRSEPRAHLDTLAFCVCLEDCVKPLPLIVGYGGVNAAGRTSEHQAFRRLVFSSLSQADQTDTLNQLGAFMGLGTEAGQNPTQRTQILQNTLVRHIHPDWFDPDHVPVHRLGHVKETTSLWLNPLQIPDPLPSGWVRGATEGRLTEFKLAPGELLTPGTRKSTVQAAGMAPTGFRPDQFYPSRNHPRTLQLALFALSDCWLSSGLDWTDVRQQLRPDQIAVFAGSSIGQMDDAGFGGMLKSAGLAKRTTSKQLPLGYPQMPADFANAYVMGSLGRSGASMGACASFLYNLQHAVEGIQEGRYLIAVVGGADCPITPEVIEGFRAMGALAEDQGLRELDGLSADDTPDYRKTSRPFGLNCGFTMGESSQYLILMADHLAVSIGARIFGAVPFVASHADGGKRSISAPGAGNYLTLARAAAVIRDLLGHQALAEHTLVQAHGTSTPQNRVTESDVLSRVALAFGIEKWPVTAIKGLLGHSQGTAGGDQLAMSLSAFALQLAPGIQTTDAIAADVVMDGLDFQLQSNARVLHAALINAKGFGGNNATAAILSPDATARLLGSRFGDVQIEGSMQTQERQARYSREIGRGTIEILYHYGEQVVEGADLALSDHQVTVPGFGRPIELDAARALYSDLIEPKL